MKGMEQDMQVEMDNLRRHLKGAEEALRRLREQADEEERERRRRERGADRREVALRDRE